MNTANDNASHLTTTTTAALAGILGDGAARWTVEGWAAHIAPARHALHAVNSFVKHEGEFGPVGSVLWTCAMVATLARCVDLGLGAHAAAMAIEVRRERRAGRAAA